MLQLNFDPFPSIQTPRLALRQLSEHDAEDIFTLRNNDQAMEFINRPRLKTKEDAIALIKIMSNIEERIVWGITLRDQDKIIGSIGYHKIEKENYRAEIGYMLLPEYWKTGLMTEALTKVISYGFNDMNLHSIEAVINPGNDASRKILQKFNFIKEGYYKENYFFEGKFLDSEVYSLLGNKF